MSKDVINVGGEDRVVREDTAKAYRGVNWAWLSIGAFIVIVAVVFAVLFFGALGGGGLQSPVQKENSPNQR